MPFYLCFGKRRVYSTRDIGQDGYNVGINSGIPAGQTIPHFHVHLILRYKGDMKDPRGGVRGVIPEKQKYPPFTIPV
jgi:diadenosine tetraphosphate (Ap4A) HIT family hydrolase